MTQPPGRFAGIHARFYEPSIIPEKPPPPASGLSPPGNDLHTRVVVRTLARPRVRESGLRSNRSCLVVALPGREMRDRLSGNIGGWPSPKNPPCAETA